MSSATCLASSRQWSRSSKRPWWKINVLALKALNLPHPMGFRHAGLIRIEPDEALLGEALLMNLLPKSHVEVDRQIPIKIQHVPKTALNIIKLHLPDLNKSFADPPTAKLRMPDPLLHQASMKRSDLNISSENCLASSFSSSSDSPAFTSASMPPQPPINGLKI